MHVDRTILLQFKDEMRNVEFRVERWFMSEDSAAESVVKPALIWNMEDRDVEQVVLLGPDAVRNVIEALTAFT